MNQWRRIVMAAGAVVAALIPATGGLAARAPEQTEPPVDDSAGDAALPSPGEVIHSWALGPAADDPNSAGTRTKLSYAVDPGTVIQDAVTVYNLGNEELIFEVYATDGFNNADGAFDLLAGDQTPTGVGSWVTVSEPFVVVPPNRQATLPITLTVPPDAAPGDYVGAVLAANEALGTGEGGDLVKLDRRTGTQLLVRVAGPLTPAVAVTNIRTDYSSSLSPLSGSAVVTYKLENRGNVRVSGTARTSVAGPFGLARDVAAAGIDFVDLLPGESIDVTASLDSVPSLGVGFTTVDVDASGEGVEIESIRGSSVFVAPPIAVLLLLLVVMFGALGVRAFRRHRLRDAETAQSDDSAGKSTQDILEHQPT